MDRPVVGFHQDGAGDWVAELSCGHSQHARHRPPFMLRPWVETEEGRASKLGALLACPGCDRRERPESFVPHRRTDVFTEATTPRGLLADHTTKRGVWGRIVVLEGSLRYHIPSLDHVEVLSPEREGTVVPELPHHLEHTGSVRFFVELFRAPMPSKV